MQGFRQKIFRFLARVPAFALLALCGCPEETPAPAGIPVEAIDAGDSDVLEPARTGTLDRRLVRECSGFAASKKFPGIFWTLSDSENSATVVAIRADGTVVKPANAGANYRGIEVKGARNIDWESLVLDGKNNLIICDTGNNRSARKNLRLLVAPEPDPRKDVSISPRVVPVRFSDQISFPDKKKRYDCEATFVWNDAIYCLTKRWTDTWTVLYRMEMQADGSGLFKPVTCFDSRGLVTDAAISPDGRMLAILTYKQIWVFILPKSGVNPLAGSVLTRPLQFPGTSWQVEAVAFSGNDKLLVGCEEGDLYTIDVSRLAKVR